MVFRLLLLLRFPYSHLLMHGRSFFFRFSLLLGLALVLAGPAQAQTITPIIEARDTNGETVTIEGTVSRAFGTFARLQDDSGPTGASGIAIRQTSGDEAEAFQNDIESGAIQPGTVLRITGSVSFFAGLAQINGSDMESYEIVSQGEPPEPQVITLADLSDATDDDPEGGDKWESELVRIEDLSFSANGTFSNGTTYEVTDPSGTFDIFRIQDSGESNLGGLPIPGTPINFEGVIGQFHGFDFNDEPNTGYQITPVRVTDLNLPLVRLGGTFAVAEEGEEVSVTIQALGLQAGQQTEVSLAVTGGTASLADDVSGLDPTTTVTLTPDNSVSTVAVTTEIDDDMEGLEQLELTLTADANAITADPSRFTLWIQDDPLAQTTYFPDAPTADALADSVETTFGDAPTLGYNTRARDSLYARLFNDDGRVRGFYTGFEISLDPNNSNLTGTAADAGINTEHVWPRSKGSENEPALSDIYILVPARDTVNTARLNFPFGESDDETETDVWYRGDVTRSTAPPPIERDQWSELNNNVDGEQRFEPRESVKGDIARAVFYFKATYPDLADQSFFDAQRTELYQWHLADPVDAAEVDRAIQIASLQGNTLNPFIFDATLAARLFGFDDDAIAPVPPTTLTALANRGRVDLSWSANAESDVASYNVYRSASGLPTISDDQRIASVDAGTTTYADEGAASDQSFAYRITAVDDEGNESLLSNSTSNSSIPLNVSLDVTGVFGSSDNARNYRLVALPGATNRPLGETLSGQASTDWQAYWDNGADSDFFVPFDGSDTFTLAPGTGFWLLSDAPWTVTGDVPTVELAEDGTYTIPLHNGWNIISNPFDVDIAWPNVVAANGGDLNTLWQWSSGFVPAATFATAQTGRAYYFFNDTGAASLTLPYPGAAPEGVSPDAVRTPPAITLTATVDGQPASAVQVGMAEGARDGWDRYDEVAPPSRFQVASLRLPSATDDAPRAQWLARDVRTPQADGHTFDLTLTTEPGTPVTLTAENVDAVNEQRVALVNRQSGETFDLTREGAAHIVPTTADTPLRVLVGTPQFVDTEADATTPQRLQLRSAYPNPFRARTTVEFSLPEATDVRLAVYDMLGREVATLVNDRHQAGFHQMTWTPRGLASGMYMLRMEADGQQLTRKLVHVR